MMRVGEASVRKQKLIGSIVFEVFSKLDFHAKYKF